jgi:hypothetical protein
MKLLAKPVLPMMLLVSATSHATPPAAIDVGSIQELTDQASIYDNHVVRFEACVLVTPHGMALFGCGANLKDPLVFFRKPDSPTSGAAYDALVRAGFRATSRQLVSLTVTGRFDYSPDQLPHFTVDIRDASNIRFIQDPRPAGDGIANDACRGMLLCGSP